MPDAIFWNCLWFLESSHVRHWPVCREIQHLQHFFSVWRLSYFLFLSMKAILSGPVFSMLSGFFSNWIVFLFLRVGQSSNQAERLRRNALSQIVVYPQFQFPGSMVNWTEQCYLHFSHHRFLLSCWPSVAVNILMNLWVSVWADF